MTIFPSKHSPPIDPSAWRQLAPVNGAQCCHLTEIKEIGRVPHVRLGVHGPKTKGGAHRSLSRNDHKTLIEALTILLFVLAFLLVSPVLAFAQINANATISGHVTDPSGAAIPNASVSIANDTTGITSAVATNAGGYYVAAFLKPGTYTISVSAPGFQAAVRKSLTLQVQQVVEQDFALSVGQVQQQVTVTGGAPLLNTESAELGNVVTQESAQQLPLNGRNFSQLGVLVPGANSGAVGSIRSSGNGNETQRAGAEIVANGSRGSFNLFMVDGLDDRDQSVGTVKVFPNLESIGQFKVQIGNYDAEFGAGGAVVNVITRSGSNELHGSAFEFFRNASIEAVPFFAKTTPPYQLNQFGGSLGGPVRRNRTFFFADYQGLRVKQTSTSVISEPTPALRSGNFSALPAVIYDPSTYNAATNTRQAFPGKHHSRRSHQSGCAESAGYFPPPYVERRFQQSAAERCG